MHNLTHERREALHQRMLAYYRGSESYFDDVREIAGERPSQEERTLFEEVARAVSASRGAVQLLELGCGRCEGAPVLLCMLGGGQLAALDASPSAIQDAKKRLPNADLRVGDIRSLPYESASFDVVISNYVLEHTCEPNRVMSEAIRVLRLGGVFGMIVPVVDAVWMLPGSLRHRQRDLKFVAEFAFRRWIHFLRLRYDPTYFAFPLVEDPVVFTASNRQFLPDDDQVYVGSTLELVKFLRANGCEIVYSGGRDIRSFVRNGRRPWVDITRELVFGLMRTSLRTPAWEEFTTTRTLVARKTSRV